MNRIFTELKIGIVISMATYALLIKMYDLKLNLKTSTSFHFIKKKKMKITLAVLPVRYQSQNNINSPNHNL